MPYIQRADREILTPLRWTGSEPINAGELAFCLTAPIKRYLEAARRVNGEVKFADLANVLAALESVANEFREGPLRRYEDRKKRENGDVDWGVE